MMGDDSLFVKRTLSRLQLTCWIRTMKISFKFDWFRPRSLNALSKRRESRAEAEYPREVAEVLLPFFVQI